MSDNTNGLVASAEEFYVMTDEQIARYGEEHQRDWETDQEMNEILGLKPEPEIGRRLYTLACQDLKARGINPDDVDAEMLLAALKRAS
jgi:hypothetical protein